MLLGLDRLELQNLAFDHGRQAMLQLFVFFVLLILAFFVDRKEAVELRHRSRRAEPILVAVLALSR